MNKKVIHMKTDYFEYHTICGLNAWYGREHEDQLTSSWDFVTCKNCLHCAPDWFKEKKK